MAGPLDVNHRSQIAASTRAVEYARRAANVDASKLELLVDHLHSLAELRVKEGDFLRAESLLREANFRIEEANANHRLRPRPVLAANVASSLGYLYDRWNKEELSRKWYGKSLELAETEGFFDSELGASVSNNLGMLDKKSGHFASAQDHYQRSLSIFQALKGPSSVEVAAVLNNLGVLFYSRGDLPKALKAHEDALAIRLTLHNPATGEGHHDLCQTWRNLAAVFTSQNEPDKSASLMRQAGLVEEPLEALTPNWIIKPSVLIASAPAATAQPISAASRPSANEFLVKVHQK